MEDQTNKFIGELEAVAHHMIHSHMIHNAGLKAIAATAERRCRSFRGPSFRQERKNENCNRFNSRASNGRPGAG
jgi:hypothetical protein